MDIKGGCLCGAVRYEASGDPMFVGKCFCTDCQRWSGNGHSTTVAFTAPQVKMTGAAPKTFSVSAENGKQVTRHFCATCGSAIYSETESMPGVIMLRPGGFDDPSAIAVQVAVYTQSARGYDPVPAGMTSFPKMPAM